MVLANATIYTTEPACPFDDAMAVRGDRVLCVGTYEPVKVTFVDALSSRASLPLALLFPLPWQA
jgi:predicted amidohydrolase YtcJ